MSEEERRFRRSMDVMREAGVFGEISGSEAAMLYGRLQRERAKENDERKTAMRWALVKFVVALEERQAEDAATACEANGWRQRSAHDLYDDVIDTVSRLATGSLDASAYLEEERRIALEQE